MNIKLIKHLAKSDGVSKGVLRVENRVVKETTDILKRLTPKNQSYFMTLVRLAEVAENAVRHQERMGLREETGPQKRMGHRGAIPVSALRDEDKKSVERVL